MANREPGLKRLQQRLRLAFAHRYHLAAAEHLVRLTQTRAQPALRTRVRCRYTTIPIAARAILKHEPK